LSFHPTPVDLRQVATSVCDQIKRRADQKGLVVRVEFDPDIPPLVEADRLRLQQVLTNLLTNAVKYTERGVVTLQFRGEDRSSDHVTLDIAVLDTGIGLAQEDIPRILREFGRLDRPADRKEAGTGLGLAIVQRLLNAMGSMLKVESVPGQGSRFHFRLNLPILPADAWLNEAQQLADYMILYVEDEPVIRQLTAQRLQEAGAQVVSATDGEHALRLLTDVAPDLLLIDLQMPGLDGVGLIQQLHKSSPEIQYPIFVLTSHISGPKAADARAAGADAVFTKPIQVAALAAALRARHGNFGKSTPIAGGGHDIADEPLLDMEVVQDISAFKDRNKALGLITQFEETMRADFGAMSAALDTKDMRETAKIAHRSQGLCLVIGAKRLAGRLKRIEVKAADPASQAAMASLVSELDMILSFTSAELHAISEPTASSPLGVS
jgi:CheY-like chemotaxis protein/anti-sigma regulatory factor (Ser/Thr protein kinase)